MDAIAAKILDSRIVEDEQGNQYPLHSETGAWQCEALQKIIEQKRPEVSLEIGLAYGISSLFLCEALQKVGARKHIIIDPMQHSDWHGIGLRNLRAAGYEDLIEFYEQYSHDVLPSLLRSGSRIDFAYIDTTKLFDVVFTDTYFLTRLLPVGGLLFIDDCNGPGIRKVCRFLAQHPSWRVHSCLGATPPSWKQVVLSRFANRIPRREKIFSSDIVTLDSTLGVSGQCIGFEKVKEDDRHWAWHIHF